MPTFSILFYEVLQIIDWWIGQCSNYYLSRQYHTRCQWIKNWIKTYNCAMSDLFLHHSNHSVQEILIDWSELTLTYTVSKNSRNKEKILRKRGVPGFTDKLKIPYPRKQKKSIPLSSDAEPVPARWIRLKRKTKRLGSSNQSQTRLSFKLSKYKI